MALLRNFNFSDGAEACVYRRLYRPPSSPRRSGVGPDLAITASSLVTASTGLPAFERANASSSLTSTRSPNSTGSLLIKSATQFQSSALSAESFNNLKRARNVGAVTGGFQYRSTRSFA